MKKKQKNILIIFLVASIIIVTGVSLKYFYREQGNFYELEMGKYYTNKIFSTIFISRTNPSENNFNPETIEDLGRSSKIFSYLNEFDLTECKITTNSNTSAKDSYEGIYSLSFVAEDSTVLDIRIYNVECIEISVTTTKDQAKKSSKITKYYKITNGTISSEHLEELLN
ncbi:hypothetical protein [Clostridium sp.]|uniref:hypothetical protein n=1 Tax=Clostridium sp. TaxID=1506 RepID=UPI0032162523